MATLVLRDGTRIESQTECEASSIGEVPDALPGDAVPGELPEGVEAEDVVGMRLEVVGLRQDGSPWRPL